MFIIGANGFHRLNTANLVPRTGWFHGLILLTLTSSDPTITIERVKSFSCDWGMVSHNDQRGVSLLIDKKIGAAKTNRDATFCMSPTA